MSIWLTISRAIDFCLHLQYEAQINSCRVGLKSKERAADYPYNSHATIIQMGTSFWTASHYSYSAVNTVTFIMCLLML